MANASASTARLPAPPQAVLGVSTKGLPCDDPIARLIENEFVDRVGDPRLLMFCLPHDLLTPSDEDRVVTVLTSRGQTDAARLLLALITQRGNWIPRLQEGLRHNQVRLGDLADRIDQLQCQVPMEIDLADGDYTGMEVDAEPFDTSAVPNPAALAMLAGQHPGQLDPQQLRAYQEFVMADIARHFFTGIAESVEDVDRLTQCYERIASVVTTQYAVGCLEMRLSLASSRDLSDFRRLAAGQALHETIEHAVLTPERRQWLQSKAKSYGLKWNHINLRVTVKRDDLYRCETSLKVLEETADPGSPAEALLRKTAIRKRGEGGTLPEDRVGSLPKLLLSFVDWLLEQQPALAETVAAILLTSPLDVGLTETMATCRQFFGLSNQHEEDLAEVLLLMLRHLEEEPEEMYDDAVSFVQPEIRGQPIAARKPVSWLPRSDLFVEAAPQSPVAERVDRLVGAKLMVPVDLAGKTNIYGFSSPFVADYAMTCSTHVHAGPPSSEYIWGSSEDYICQALTHGSSFAILHLLDIAVLLSLPRTQLSTGVRADEHFGRVTKLSALRQRTIRATELAQALSTGDHPLAVVEAYMAFSQFLRGRVTTSLFDRSWVTFGPEWKGMARDLLASGQPGALPDILLAPVSSIEWPGVKDLAEQVLSAKRTMDLTGKLENLAIDPLRVILGCAQLCNVCTFSLVYVDGFAALRASPTEQESSVRSQAAVGQPALKLCENVLQEEQVECLLDAMPGLESVSHLNLSACTVSPDGFQRILNSLPAQSMRTLNLSEITFSGSRGGFLPRFSHLKRLQNLDLGFMGLRDDQMAELVQQLSALPDLRELTLEQNPITTAGLSELTPALASRGTLRVLRLPHCQLDTGAAFVLGAMLTSSRYLHVLNLSNCSLQDSGLQHLSLVIKNHTHLTKVSLRSGQYSPQGLASFLTYLARCGRMQHLEIGQCPLEADGFDISDKLIKALKASSLWDFLGLWQCRLGRTAFLQNLLSVETQLRGLRILVLQENHLDDDSMVHLAEAAKRGVFRYLKQLNLRQNNIQAAGAERLAGALLYLPRLQELLLQHSVIPPPAAVSLSRAVLRLPDMKTLELCDSYAMDYQQIHDVMLETARIVGEEKVAVGEGVKFAENDELLESRFVEDNLRLLGPFDGKTATPETPPEQSTAGDEGEGSSGSGTVQSEPATQLTTPHFRQLAEFHGDKVVVDQVLWISFGHN